MTRELAPFLIWPDNLLLKLSHQSSKISSSKPGASACSPRLCSKLNQNWLEKTQAIKRWSKVSSTWSQRGQTAGWGSSFFARLSAVQHFLCVADLPSTPRILPGAQLFQILSNSNKKKASYTDFVEYWPDAEYCQMWVSSTSGEDNQLGHLIVRAPLMSEIHLLSSRASCTVLFFALAATAPIKWGKVWSSHCPRSHLSVQKKMYFFYFQLRR